MDLTALDRRQPVRWSTAVLVWWSLVVVATVGGALWLTRSGGSYRDLSAPVVLIAYAPSLAAVAAVLLLRRGSGRALLDRCRRWRVPGRWYALALLGPRVLLVVAAAAAAALHGVPVGSAPLLPSVAALPALLGPVVSGAVGEELGWRGFAQPQLERRWSQLAAAVAVGLLWSLWHLWPVLTPLGRIELTAADVGQTVVRLVATAVLYAWRLDATGVSLPVVLVAHGAHNLAIGLLPASLVDGWLVALVYVVAASAVLIRSAYVAISPSA